MDKVKPVRVCVRIGALLADVLSARRGDVVHHGDTPCNQLEVLDAATADFDACRLYGSGISPARGTAGGTREHR